MKKSKRKPSMNGMGLEDEKLKPGKEYMMKKSGMSKKKKIKAQEGVMIEEAQSPSLMGGLGAQAAPEAMGSEGMSSDDRFSEIDLDYAEEVARRSPPMKEKSITPKERREKDIAKRAKKKMGGGMMSDGIANRGSGIEMKSKGGMVRGQGIAIRGTKFKGIF
jgi:hypothetical protein